MLRELETPDRGGAGRFGPKQQSKEDFTVDFLLALIEFIFYYAADLVLSPILSAILGIFEGGPTLA